MTSEKNQALAGGSWEVLWVYWVTVKDLLGFTGLVLRIFLGKPYYLPYIYLLW